MRSPDVLRQLANLKTLGNMREQRARVAHRRALAERDAAARRIGETQRAIEALEAERRALFGKLDGMMTRAGLLQLKRRESALEHRRIELALDSRTHEDARALAERSAHEALARATEARHRHDKLTCVLHRFRRDLRCDMQAREDNETEELQ